MVKKFLVVADIHGDLDNLYTIASSVKEVDAALIAGDLTPFGPKSLVIGIYDILSAITDYIFAVPGNEDPVDVRKEMDRFGINIHGKAVEVDDISIIGFEGGRWLESEEGYFLVYDPVHKLIEQEKTKGNFTILLTHVPPFDTAADKLWTSQHVGSVFLRNLLEEYGVDLNICGHIHESRAIDQLGKTTILNPGAVADGYAAIVEISGKEINKIKMLQVSKGKVEGL